MHNAWRHVTQCVCSTEHGALGTIYSSNLVGRTKWKGTSGQFWEREGNFPRVAYFWSDLWSQPATERSRLGDMGACPSPPPLFASEPHYNFRPRWTSRATAGHLENFLAGPVYGEKLWILLFRIAHSGAFFVFQRRLGPKRRGARGKLFLSWRGCRPQIFCIVYPA